MTLDKELRALIEQGLTFSTAVSVFAEVQTLQNPELDPYFQNAGDMSCVLEGECEIDSQGPGGATIVSKGDDAGAYVLAWVWVDDETAGIETPDEEKA